MHVRTMAARVAVIFACLWLAACGPSGGNLASGGADAAGVRLDERNADAARASADPSRAFAFIRYDADLSQAQPRACLSFSSTLDPERDYSPYVSAAGGRKLALAVDGQKLCIGGLSFADATEITLRSGLPALDKRTLASDQTITIEFGDRPAYVGFRGDGVILPRIDADGFAIETVNVARVGVKIVRVTDRALVFKSITRGYTVGNGEYAWLDNQEDPWDVAEPVWEGSVETAGAQNAPVTTVIPLAKTIGRAQPGAYFVELDQLGADGKPVDDAARSRRWLVVTDLALTSYSGGSGAFVGVRSLQTAKPVKGVRLELLARNNSILAAGLTDENGHVRFPAAVTRGEGPMSPRLVTAYGPAGDFAVLDFDRSPVDLSDRDIGGREPAQAVDAFVYLDRGVYRPGETVRANALLRDNVARAVSDRAGSLVVYGPNGIESSRKRFDKAEAAGAVGYDVVLPRSAARGPWRIDAVVDGVGVVGSRTFAVEDFVPQRIALEIKGDTTAPVLANETRALDVNVRFLYGAPGAGLPVEGNVRIETDPSPFRDVAKDALKGFSWGRHTETFRETSFDTPLQTTDGAGMATLALAPSEYGASSSRPLRLHAVVSAVEPGGRAVRDDVRVPFLPSDRYLGVKPDFADGYATEGAAAQFEIALVDRKGALSAGDAKWRLVRIDWDYNWYKADDGQWRWRSTREVVPVEEGAVRTAAGKTGLIKTRNLDWGDYELHLIDPASGAEASVGFWAGWGGQPQDGVEAPDRVRIVAPETAPKVGQTAEIAILPPYAGEAEIVIAAENVIYSKTLKVSEKGARIKVPVTREWGGGVYVMATVYTPRDAVKQPKPRRAVGVSHVAVDVSQRTFKLDVQTPEKVRPRGPVTVSLSTRQGPVNERGFVTVAAVDEGILLLTKHRTPDPAEHFFGKRRLGVSLYDDYGRLLDPNQGAAADVRSGGDQIGGAGLSVVPTKTVALYSGPVEFRNGKAEVKIDLPDFNGELRLMAVAWSDTGVGSGAKPLTVRDSVPAELVLPRFLAPGDRAQATATIDNVEGPAGAFNVSVAASGAVKAGGAPQSQTIAKAQRRDLALPVEGGQLGIGKLTLKIAGPQNLAISREYPIETRSAWMPVSRVQRQLVQPGAAFTPDPRLSASLLASSVSAQVSFSPIPVDAAALYDSLDRYPYGCTEQIVSRAMPLLYADKLAAIAGRKTEAEVRAQVQETVSTLLNRQGPDGAFGLWRTGDRDATPWLGAYATDFLARAKKAGYVVPDEAMTLALKALEDVAVRENTWSTGYDFDVYEGPYSNDTREASLDRAVAYAAYVLAREGVMDRSRLRYLSDERMTRIASPLARAQIAAGLAMIGDKTRSTAAFDKAEQALGWTGSGDYYQTPRRDLAGVLALAQEAGAADRVQRLGQRVSRDLPEPDRLSTQEKAFLLLAANALMGDAAAPRVSLKGDAQTLSPDRAFRLSGGQLASSPVFTNASKAPLWATSVVRGTATSAPEAVDEGLTLRKSVWTMSGQRLDGTQVAQGTRLIVSVEVSSQFDRATPVVVADLLPAGFEIETILKPGDAGNFGPYGWLGELQDAQIAEARDDRFVAADTLYDRRAARFAYVVRAVTPGQFTFPGAHAEDMYKSDVFARTAASQIGVIQRK